MVYELAIQLIQRKPQLGISPDSLGKGLHGKIDLIQPVHELGRVINGLIQMSKIPIPVALPTLPHHQRTLAGGDGTFYNIFYQVAEDFLIDQAKIVQLKQAAVVLLLKVLFDLQEIGAFVGQFFKGRVVADAVLPTL